MNVKEICFLSGAAVEEGGAGSDENGTVDEKSEREEGNYKFSDGVAHAIANGSYRRAVFEIDG